MCSGAVSSDNWHLNKWVKNQKQADAADKLCFFGFCLKFNLRVILSRRRDHNHESNLISNFEIAITFSS